MSIKMNAASAAAILAALAIIPAVSAHGHVKEIVANGETVEGTTPNWVYQETNTPGCMYNQRGCLRINADLKKGTPRTKTTGSLSPPPSAAPTLFATRYFAIQGILQDISDLF
jgi:hypothetical protein